jgi:hypothetical protein
MKKLFLFKTILVLSIAIFPAMASAFDITEFTICDLTEITSNCSTTYTWPDQASTSDLIYTIPFNNFTATSGSTSAVIDTTWTFGEMFISFLIIFFIGYTLIKDVLRFFFPDKIRVLRIKDAL